MLSDCCPSWPGQPLLPAGLTCILSPALASMPQAAPAWRSSSSTWCSGLMPCLRPVSWHSLQHTGCLQGCAAMVLPKYLKSSPGAPVCSSRPCGQGPLSWYSGPQLQRFLLCWQHWSMPPPRGWQSHQCHLPVAGRAVLTGSALGKFPDVAWRFLRSHLCLNSLLHLCLPCLHYF